MAIATFARPTQLKKDKRTRIQLRVWLDAMCDRSLILLEEIDFLKSRRQFQSTFRDAFDLLLSLRRGEVDTLLRLFPWIEDYFKARQDSPAVLEFALLMKQQVAILERLSTQAPMQPSAPTYLNMPKFDDAPMPSIFTQDVTPDVSAAEARVNFSQGLGDIFADDDVWDD